MFEPIDQKDGSVVDTQILAEVTNCHEVLLSKGLYYNIKEPWTLANKLGTNTSLSSSMGMIADSAKDTFAANNISKALANSGYEAGIHHKCYKFAKPFVKYLNRWQY